jgi:hypothetical protein
LIATLSTDQFDGAYVRVEVVKAFIPSIGYRQRFGPWPTVDQGCFTAFLDHAPDALTFYPQLNSCPEYLLTYKFTYA